MPVFLRETRTLEESGWQELADSESVSPDCRRCNELPASIRIAGNAFPSVGGKADFREIAVSWAV
jgi:hypothetical protein